LLSDIAGSLAVQKEGRQTLVVSQKKNLLEISQILLIFSLSIDTIFTVIMVGQVSACLAAKNREKTPTGVRHRWLTSHAGTLFMDLMRDDENASSPKKKVSRAFYPELLDEVAWFDAWYSLQKTRTEEEAEERSRKTEIWHIFEAS
jgi:hypothetical protein